VDFFVPTAVGLNNSFTRPIGNIRCNSDDTKPSLEFFVLGFQASSDIDYTQKYLSSCSRTLGVSIIGLIALKPMKMNYSEFTRYLIGYIIITIINGLLKKTH